jgi:hypothetical protein
MLLGAVEAEAAAFLGGRGSVGSADGSASLLAFEVTARQGGQRPERCRTCHADGLQQGYLDVPELDCPELAGGVVVALGVLELGVELLPLAALPEVLDCPVVLPEAAPLAASFMHFSFSAPIR